MALQPRLAGSDRSQIIWPIWVVDVPGNGCDCDSKQNPESHACRDIDPCWALREFPNPLTQHFKQWWKGSCRLTIGVLPVHAEGILPVRLRGLVVGTLRGRSNDRVAAERQLFLFCFLAVGIWQVRVRELAAETWLFPISFLAVGKSQVLVYHQPSPLPGCPQSRSFGIKDIGPRITFP